MISKMHGSRGEEIKAKEGMEYQPAWAKVSQTLGVLPSSLAGPSTYSYVIIFTSIIIMTYIP